MPEFERDAWGQEDAHQAQLRHYGIKQGVLPDDRAAPRGPILPAGTKLTEGTGMPIPGRKPVPNSDSSCRGRSPRPTTPSQRPQIPRTQSPAPETQPSRTQSPRRKPVPTGDSSSRGRSPGPTTPSQRPQTPRTQSPVPEPQSSRTQSPKRTIKRTGSGRFDPNSIQGPRQAPAPPATPTTPRSPRPARKRTDSDASTSSRRSSFRGGLRRLSDAFKQKMNIVSMDRSDRMEYVKSRDTFERSRESSSVRSPQPASPRSLRIGPRIGTSRFGEDLDDASIHSSAPSSTSKNLPGNLTRGETFAISVSKAVDPFKQKRKGTQDSDMSFGMTDLAPPGAMDVCESCGMPTEEFLIKGLCKQCHELHAKVAKAKRDKDPGATFVDPWQFPQGRSTWPDVPTADQKYMKLPHQKKIVRIRETVYEDPGNPFANARGPFSPTRSPLEDKPLPPIPAMIKGLRGSDLFDVNPFDDGAFSKVPATPKNSVGDIWASILPPDNDRIRNHLRSKSAAMPMPDQMEESGEYIAPRRFWRKASMPNTHLSQPIPPSHDPWRDTKFEDFYDDLLKDYSALRVNENDAGNQSKAKRLMEPVRQVDVPYDRDDIGWRRFA